MKGTNDDSDTASVPTREEILTRLSDIADYCEHKLLKGHVKDSVRERVRQGWATVAVSGLKACLIGLNGNVPDNGVARDKIVFVRADEGSPNNEDI
jgi:hypothetical protein